VSKRNRLFRVHCGTILRKRGFTMTNVRELMDPELLVEMLSLGFVRSQTHPDPEVPYRVYNYTEKAVWEREWNDATLNCRGLILNKGEVVARGMKKFFNFGEVSAPVFAPDDRVQVTDKSDGSLAIAHRLPDKSLAVATRGSFASDQAIHATTLLNSSVSALGIVSAMLDRGLTPLMEVVYPENRIVLDYGGADELIFLGVQPMAGQEFIPLSPDNWPWSCAESIGWMTFTEALALPDRENAEGVVITRVSDGAMVKVKQEDYLRLHKALSGLSARSLWQLIVDGENVHEFILSLPDEFQAWADDTVDGFDELVAAREVSTIGAFDRITDYLDNVYGQDGWEKKDFAKEVMITVPEISGHMFSLYDGRDITKKLLREAKPEADKRPTGNYTERVDNAI